MGCLNWLSLTIGNVCKAGIIWWLHMTPDTYYCVGVRPPKILTPTSLHVCSLSLMRTHFFFGIVFRIHTISFDYLLGCDSPKMTRSFFHLTPCQFSSTCSVRVVDILWGNSLLIIFPHSFFNFNIIWLLDWQGDFQSPCFSFSANWWCV